MNTTSDAPRLSASMPTAPVPANTSRKWQPEMRPARTLKSDSRRRSLVGRRARPLRLLSWRLRNVPAMMRMVVPVSLSRRERGDNGVAIRQEGDAARAEALPSGQAARRGRTLPCGRVREAGDRGSGWPRGSRVGRTAGCQKTRRGREAGDRFRRFQNRRWCGPSFRGARAHRRSYGWARRGCSGTAAHRGQCARGAGAVGKTEAFRVLNDHDRGVGDVHTHLDDRGGHENLNLVTAEFLHDVFFFLAGKAAVEQAELEFRENGF